jgi:hypothetical protein
MFSILDFLLRRQRVFIKLFCADCIDIIYATIRNSDIINNPKGNTFVFVTK